MLYLIRFQLAPLIHGEPLNSIARSDKTCLPISASVAKNLYDAPGIQFDRVSTSDLSAFR
jgi:hypothetical protein